MNKCKVFFVAFLLLFLAFVNVSFSGLVNSNNLIYKGAFKTPTGDDTYSYGGSNLAYNPENNSLFIGVKGTAELAIPVPVISSDASLLPRANEIQAPVDISEGHSKNIAIGGTEISGTSVRQGGLMVYNGKLIGTEYAFYSSSAVLSHFTSSLDVSVTGDFSGMYAVGVAPEVPTASFVSGWMGHIPEKWQASLGGPAFTGQGSLSVLSRTSYGPAAFSFDPDQLGKVDPVPAHALLYYPTDHPLEYHSSSNKRWNGTTKMAGAVMVEDSILFFGYHGLGEYNYGEPDSDTIYADECRAPDNCVTGPKRWPVCSDPYNCVSGRKGIPNDPLCDGSGSDGCYYDPTGMGSKGPHAYPYIYQVWAYSLSDLAAVRKGEMEPWEPQPYAIWELPFDVVPTSIYGGAAAFDSINKLLYVTQPAGELYGCCQKIPVIHVFQLNMDVLSLSSYSVGGRVVLLDGTIELANNNGDVISISSDDRSASLEFQFPAKFSNGSQYNVKINRQPEDQICRVHNSIGKITGNSNVTSVIVSCAQRKLDPPMLK